MAERGLGIDHSTVHRWVVLFSPQLLECFHQRKRAVTGKWHLDETYIKVRGTWTYLYRVIARTLLPNSLSHRKLSHHTSIFVFQVMTMIHVRGIGISVV